MGEAAAVIRIIRPAKEIIDDMVKEAIERLEIGYTFIEAAARL